MLRWPTRDLRSSQAQASPDSILDPIAPAPSADDVIAGYKQLIARAHLHKMRIIGATLTPFEDTFKGSPLEGCSMPTLLRPWRLWLGLRSNFDGRS